jgi:hypothetical protein
LKTKCYLVKAVVRILPSLFQSKNSTQKRALTMNQVVVRLVVQPENNKIAALVAGAGAGIVANNVKCIRQSVLLVEKKQLYLSNPQVTDRYIVVIATSRVRAATGKISRDLLKRSS